MNRRVMLGSLTSLPCLAAAAAIATAGAEEKEDKLEEKKLRALTSGTQIKIFCIHVAGNDACAYLETEGSHFYLRLSYGHWSTRIDLGQGEVTVPLGPASLTITVSNLHVTDNKITFHLKVVAKVAVLTVTLFDKDVSINRPSLLAEYKPETWKPDTVLLTIRDAS